MIKKRCYLWCNAVILVLCMSQCTTPYSFLEGKVWDGKIFRTADDELLSKVVMRMNDDTMFVYANAIFGASNDTLLLKEFRIEDSLFLLSGEQGDEFYLSFRKQKEGKEGGIRLQGDDFYLELTQNPAYIADELFYQNQSVPRDADIYPSGMYQGLVSSAAPHDRGNIQGMEQGMMRIVFGDDFCASIHFYPFHDKEGIEGLLMNKPQEVTYRYVNNRVVFDAGIMENTPFALFSHGEILALESHQWSVELNKMQ